MVILPGGTRPQLVFPPRRPDLDEGPGLDEERDRSMSLGPILSYGPRDLRALEQGNGGALTALVGRGNRRHRAIQERLSEVKAWYPVDHPNLTVVVDQLDLERLQTQVADLSPGRFCDTHALRFTIMAVPRWLHHAFDGSPRAQELGAINCPRRALEEHSNFVKVLLHYNVKVFLMLQEGCGLYPHPLTEAVFTQDPVIPIGKALCIANMGHPVRQLETRAFRGRFQIKNFCEPGGIVEGGDVIPLYGDARRPGEPTQVVFQGLNGLRSNPASIRGMRRLLDSLHAMAEIDRPELVPTELAGPHVLHLDYAVSILGQGEQRRLIVCPDALRDGKDAVRKLEEISGAQDRKEISMAAMEAGLGNLGVINETTATIVEPTAPRFRDVWPEYDRLLKELNRDGFIVIPLRYEQKTQKDGGERCTHLRGTAPPGWAPPSQA